MIYAAIWFSVVILIILGAGFVYSKFSAHKAERYWDTHRPYGPQ